MRELRKTRGENVQEERVVVVVGGGLSLLSSRASGLCDANQKADAISLFLPTTYLIILYFYMVCGNRPKNTG